jgi:hypothetical protein
MARAEDLADRALGFPASRWPTRSASRTATRRATTCCRNVLVLVLVVVLWCRIEDDDEEEYEELPAAKKLSPLPSVSVREYPYLRCGQATDRFITPPGMEMPEAVGQTSTPLT